MRYMTSLLIAFMLLGVSTPVHAESFAEMKARIKMKRQTTLSEKRASFAEKRRLALEQRQLKSAPVSNEADRIAELEKQIKELQKISGVPASEELDRGQDLQNQADAIFRDMDRIESDFLAQDWALQKSGKAHIDILNERHLLHEIAKAELARKQLALNQIQTDYSDIKGLPAFNLRRTSAISYPRHDLITDAPGTYIIDITTPGVYCQALQCVYKGDIVLWDNVPLNERENPDSYVLVVNVPPKSLVVEGKLSIYNYRRNIRGGLKTESLGSEHYGNK